MADWLPLVSQAKSLVQFICNDSKGALQTQINFSRRCPLVSQVRWFIERVFVSKKDAAKTMHEFLYTTCNGFLDSIPVLGHIKGIVHYVMGNKEMGDNAMKAASRTLTTIATSACGFLMGGPPGAIIGGLLGGLALDGLTTAIESTICKTFQPNGIIKEIKDVYDDPTNAGKWFDTIVTVVGDGATGYITGKGIAKAQIAKQLRKFECQKNILVEKVGQEATGDLIEAANLMENTRQKYNIPENKPHITSVVRDKTTNVCFDGHNDQVIKHCRSKKARKTNINNANDDVMSTYSVDKNTETHLEKKVQGVKPPLRRKPRTCAEHRAYHKFYKKHPDADPQNTRVSSVRYAKGGKITAVKRCQNCVAYGEGMGEVPGDMIDNYIIPRNHGFGKTTFRTQAVKVLLYVFSIPLLQEKGNNKRKGKHSKSAKKVEINIENANVMSYSVDRKAATYLNKKIRNVKPSFKRRSIAVCVDNRNRYKVYKQHPDADEYTRVRNLRYKKDGKTTGAYLCQNCIAYEKRIDEDRRDIIYKVPKVTNFGKVLSQADKESLLAFCTPLSEKEKRKSKLIKDRFFYRYLRASRK